MEAADLVVNAFASVRRLILVSNVMACLDILWCLSVNPLDHANSRETLNSKLKKMWKYQCVLHS
jgi:hypothetical protein